MRIAEWVSVKFCVLVSVCLSVGPEVSNKSESQWLDFLFLHKFGVADLQRHLTFQGDHKITIYGIYNKMQQDRLFAW